MAGARADTITPNIDTTLLTAHSDKERAAGNGKHGQGFHPLGCWLDETAGSRLIVRRERRHPGAQFQIFYEHGSRYACFLADQDGADIVALELRHRGRARVEDSIRAGHKTTLACPEAEARARPINIHPSPTTPRVVSSTSMPPFHPNRAVHESPSRG